MTKDNLKENNTLELKQIMTADIKKEIIAFANSEVERYILALMTAGGLLELTMQTRLFFN